MPVIPGEAVALPKPSKAALSIIEQMHVLLEGRRECRVTRKAFLLAWRRLRKALFLTPDYQAMRRRVNDRCRGICEQCRKRPMVHAHHEQRVALAPDLALDDRNCKGLCRTCHRKQPEHGSMRR